MNDEVLGDLVYLFSIKMPFSVEIALRMIPDFGGNRADLHKFLTCCDIVYDTATTREEKKSFLNVVKTKLTGAAYELIKYGEYDSWDNLKPDLQHQFLESRTIAQIQLELLNTRQKSNENVRQFATKIERLCQDLTDACVQSEGEQSAAVIRNLNKKTALKAFVEGLLPSLKFIIKASRFEDLKSAIEAACEEERTIKCTANNNNVTTSKKFLIKCFKCGKPNHKANECRSNFNNNVSTSANHSSSSKYHGLPDFQNFSKPKRETNVGTIRLTCAYCKNIGHTIDVCRKRAYNNARRSSFNNSDPTNGNSRQQNSNQNNFNSGNAQGPSTSTGGVTTVRETRTA